ncbi:MAG: hypothetical protein ABIA12_00140 [Candidatus Aenigmatarchaeota archaeon]
MRGEKNRCLGKTTVKTKIPERKRPGKRMTSGRMLGRQDSLLIF